MSNDIEALSPLSVNIQSIGVSPCNDPTSCRTTSNIVVSCLATIVLCLWAAMHPNVLYSNFEMRSDSDMERKTADVWRRILLTARRTWDNFIYRVPLFIVAIIYPEFIFMWALQQTFSSRELAKRQGWTITHGHFILMGGFHLYKEGKDGKSCPCFPLNFDTVIRLVTNRRLELPTKEEIRDKCSSSSIFKTIAFVQAAWFLINCIARSAQSLPLTKLDIVTAYYIFTALSTYIVWWDKPHNVLHPIGVSESNVKLTSQNLYNNLPSKHTSMLTLSIEELLALLCGSSAQIFDFKGSGKISRFSSAGSYIDSDIEVILMTIVMGIVSAGISCIAWSFDLAELSFTEVVLWRLFSLSFALIILFALVCIGIAILIDVGRIESGLMVFIITFYVISRIGLLILAFMALRSLPAAAYETIHWTNIIPHI